MRPVAGLVGRPDRGRLFEHATGWLSAQGFHAESDLVYAG
jgi:hypothetical protein